MYVCVCRYSVDLDYRQYRVLNNLVVVVLMKCVSECEEVIVISEFRNCYDMNKILN
jgi:hypothetical protein